MRGGYKILDLSGVALTSGTEVTVKGVYELVESLHKVILVEGLTLDSTEYKPFICPLQVAESDYTATVGNLTVKISQSDGVTVTKGE